MGLLETLQAAARDAMRARDDVARDALRMVIALVKAREIDQGRELADEDVREVLRHAVKTRTDSAQQFEAAGRAELAAKERREIEVLAGHLPRKLGPDETRALVQRAIAETKASSKRDLGQVMKAVMATHRDQVDGGLVQRLAAELLP
jgi:uncharacterized protein YqeY